MSWGLFYLVLAVFGAYLFWLLCKRAPTLPPDEPTDLVEDQLDSVGTTSSQPLIDQEGARRTFRWWDEKR